MVKEVAFTAYPAKDVRALREFYEQKLGLTFAEPFGEGGKEQYAEAVIGNNTCFAVMTVDWLGVSPCAGVVFEVDDIERTHADLKGQGIEIEDIYDTPVCRLCSFPDPEGNKVSLHQSTVPH